MRLFFFDRALLCHAVRQAAMLRVSFNLKKISIMRQTLYMTLNMLKDRNRPSSEIRKGFLKAFF